jgi:hypothetical protein
MGRVEQLQSTDRIYANVFIIVVLVHLIARLPIMFLAPYLTLGLNKTKINNI